MNAIARIRRHPAILENRDLLVAMSREDHRRVIGDVQPFVRVDGHAVRELESMRQVFEFGFEVRDRFNGPQEKLKRFFAAQLPFGQRDRFLSRKRRGRRESIDRSQICVRRFLCLFQQRGEIRQVVRKVRVPWMSLVNG